MFKTDMSVLKESCPGSKEIRTPYPEELKCLFCGHVSEIWSDEAETSCKSCKKAISREMKPSCIEWCQAAKDCVGSEKYERLMAGVAARAQTNVAARPQAETQNPKTQNK